MKRCPECYSSYPETDRFCQLDGTTLVAEPGENDRVAGVQTEEELRALLTARAQSPRRRQYWEASALVAGVLIALGLVLFLVYQWMTPETQNSSDQPATNLSVAQPQVPVPPLYSVPIASPSPSAEPSPSPSVMPSPAVQAEPARVALSSSPVSTGGNEKARRGQITIRLTNGTTVEADEVWETGEGIWYRRRGVVSLLERDKVKAIERAVEQASPSPSSPAATPTSSPTASH